MNQSKLIREIRFKEDRTDAEELLLQYRECLAKICDYMSSYDKDYAEIDITVGYIRDILNNYI